MPFEDPAQLEFRPRPEQRPRRMQPSSQSGWLVVAITAAIVFVLFVRAMLVRSAWTAGRSTDVSVAATDHVPLDKELDGQPWPVLSQPETAALQAPVLSPAPARTAMVYRCVDARGNVAFQSERCAESERTTRIINADPEPERQPQRQELPAATQYSYITRSNSDARDRQRARCVAAKRHRDQTLEAVGLARTYDLLRQLDESVYEACKGL